MGHFLKTFDKVRGVQNGRSIYHFTEINAPSLFRNLQEPQNTVKSLLTIVHRHYISVLKLQIDLTSYINPLFLCITKVPCNMFQPGFLCHIFKELSTGSLKFSVKYFIHIDDENKLNNINYTEMRETWDSHDNDIYCL